MLTKYLCFGFVACLNIFCIEAKPVNSTENGGCFDTVVNQTFEHGDFWEQPVCNSCTCFNETISCATIDCPDISSCTNVSAPNEDQCCVSCMDPLPMSETCYDGELRQHYHYGDQWKRDNCTTCTCSGDSEEPVCSSISCPLDCDGELVKVNGQCCAVCVIDVCASVLCAKPKECKTPITLPGKCCPECLKNDCYDLALNKTFQNGESWKRDDCTSCSCKGGKEICAVQDCAPFFCKNPVTTSGECCPKCPERDLEKCLERTSNVVHKEGESWLENDGCSHCVCIGNQTYCASPTCALPDCPDGDVINVKGICCPVCSSHKVCTDPLTKRLYTEGKVWQNDMCSLCECTSDGMVCNEPNEDIKDCSSVVRMNNYCKEICLDKPDDEP